VHRNRNGKQLAVASQQMIYRDPPGRPIRILEVNADITERKSAEQGLRESQAQLRALATRLQQAREEEAIRIARELHDQLGRCLTAMKMDIEGIKHGLAGDLAEGSLRALVEKVERMNQTLDETVHTVRRISGELRPGVLDDLGLAAAIEWQARDFQGALGC
jgi:signal transduction histidine kinase